VREQLVERRARLQIGALRLMRMRLGEKHRRRAEMVAADLGRRERLGVVDVGVADNRQVVAVRFERRQARRREVEAAAGGRRRPQIRFQTERGAAGAAVHHLHRDQAQLSRRRRRRAHRYHRLEQRQRDRRAEPFQQRAPRQVCLRQDHGWLNSLVTASARMRNAALFTMPSTNDDSW